MNYIIRKFEPTDKEKALRLIQEVFDERIASITQRLWDWLFLDNPFIPDGSAHILVAELNSHLVGFLGNIFVNLKIDNKIINARWGYAFATHPKHRGIGARLFKMYLNTPDVSCFGFANQRALLLETKLGAFNIAAIYSSMCILDMKALLQNKFKNKFISWVGGATGNLISKIFFTSWACDKDISITEITSFDDRFDTFWQEVSSAYPIIVVRDRKYLNWRFIGTPLAYHIFAASKNNHILGYIVLRRAEHGHLKRGYIVDILAKAGDRKTIEALISKAVLYFKENKCHIAKCLIITNQKAYYKILKRYGFLTRKTGLYFNGRTKNREWLSLIKNPHNWFITGADPDLEMWW